MGIEFYCLNRNKMKKYIVSTCINKVDAEGVMTSQYSEDEFSSKKLIKSRKKAINMAKSIINNLNDKGSYYSSFEEAQKLGFRNYNSYSVTIFFVNGKDETPIFGLDDEDQIDWLECEAQYFKDKFPKTSFIEIENSYGEMVEVIKANLYFLLSN